MLVNNAGIVALGQIGKFDMAKWQKVIDVNLTGTFLGMQAVVDAMKAAGGGSIINVSSIEGLRGAADGAPVRRLEVGGARPDQVGGDRARRRRTSGSTRSTRASSARR